MLALGVAAVVAAALAPQQTAQEILAAQLEREQAGLAEIENFTVAFTTDQGVTMPVYRERISEGGQYALRIVPPPEWQGPEALARGQAMAAGMATGIGMAGPALLSQLPAGPAGLAAMNAMGDAVTFLGAAASYQSPDAQADAREARLGMTAFAERARLVGRETINGRPAFHLVADNLGDLAVPEGEFRPREAHLWVDADHYVTLQLRVLGEATVDGNPARLTIEESRAYQNIGRFFHPLERRMRIEGLTPAQNMTDKERRDLEKAQREVAQMKAQMEANQEQLAQLPEAQRNMIMNRLNKAIEQLEALQSGGALETTTRERIMAINQGPPNEYSWQ